MKEIIRQYGAVFIVGMVLLSLIGIIAGMNIRGKSGITAISGDFLDRRLEEVSTSNNTGNYGYDKYKAVGYPKVECDSSVILCADERINIFNVIKGNDIKKKRDATQQLLEFIVNNGATISFNILVFVCTILISFIYVF